MESKETITNLENSLNYFTNTNVQLKNALKIHTQQPDSEDEVNDKDNCYQTKDSVYLSEDAEAKLSDSTHSEEECCCCPRITNGINHIDKEVKKLQNMMKNECLKLYHRGSTNIIGGGRTLKFL